MLSRRAKQSVHFDMHTHSDRSWEGKTPGRLLLRFAKVNGLQGLGICEKDAFPDEKLYGHAAGMGLKLALGIEFSCRDANIIGFGLELSSKDKRHLESVFHRIHQQTLKKSWALIERLKVWDGSITCDNISAFVGKEPHPNFVLQYMVDVRRMFPTMTEAKAFISDEGLASDLPSVSLPDPLDVVELIRKAGGVSIWAHPFLSPPERLRTFMSDFAEAGLDGVEAVYPYRENSYVGEESNEILQARTLSLTKNAEVFLSGGSDCRYPTGPFQGTRPILPGEYGITAQEAQHLRRVLH